MMKNDKLTIKQVSIPYERWCASGHFAVEKFKNFDLNEELPTRFFQVTSEKISGIYCEPCLILANFLSRKV